jgi:hypothetical protein
LELTGALLELTRALLELTRELLAFTGALVVLASADGTHRTIIPAAAAATARARLFPDMFGFLQFLETILGT